MVKLENMKKIISLTFLLCIFFSQSGIAQETYPVVFEAVQRAVLSAERTGVLNRKNCDIGAIVKKGTVIASVNTGELALKKKRATLTLKYLNKQLENMKKLKKRGLATTEDMAKAQMERDVTYTDLEILKRQIAKSNIVAPFKGIVIKCDVQSHEWVTEGQAVVELVNIEKLRTIANIPTALAVKMKNGDKHRFYVTDLDATVTGVLEAVVPEVDELSNTTKVVWMIEKRPENLMPGMKGEVRLTGGSIHE